MTILLHGSSAHPRVCFWAEAARTAPLALKAHAHAQVYKALRGGVQPVAVKVLRDPTEKQLLAFRREVSLLQGLRDPHVVQFLGVCQAHGRVMLVTEFMQVPHLAGALAPATHGPHQPPPAVMSSAAIRTLRLHVHKRIDMPAVHVLHMPPHTGCGCESRPARQMQLKHGPCTSSSQMRRQRAFGPDGCGTDLQPLIYSHLMQGGDLWNALAHTKSGRLNWYARGRQIALDIARGLVHLHSSGVIHLVSPGPCCPTHAGSVVLHTIPWGALCEMTRRVC